MQDELFEGVMVPLFLPLNENEQIIEADLVRYVHHLLDCRVHGFLVPSGTGEFYALTPEQRRRSVEIVAREVNGQVPVASITAARGLRNTLTLTQAAHEAGADAAMVTHRTTMPLTRQRSPGSSTPSPTKGRCRCGSTTIRPRLKCGSSRRRSLNWQRTRTSSASKPVAMLTSSTFISWSGPCDRIRASAC